VEIRENFEGGNSFAVSSATATTPASTSITTTLPSGTATSGTNSSASGNSSAQTLYVRRAFVYLGTDQLGIIRLGQADGIAGIFNATAIFTTGSWDGGIGNINGSGGLQVQTPNQYLLSWPFISDSGPDYANNKIVYLSPQFFGLDLGLEYDPNQGNILSNSSTSSPYQVGPCNTASANCISVTSGTDSSRWINRFGLGARYIGNFGGAVVQGYATYFLSGHSNVTIPGGAVQASPADLKAHPAVPAGPGGLAGGGTGSGSLKYDGQSFFNGGVAVSYLGFTVNADVTAGRENGSNALVTAGGAPMMAELAAISYAIGPFSVGAIGAIIDSQGAVQMTGTSQRHEFAAAVGGAYRIAPGINLALEYQYEQKHQGGFNFNTGAAGVPTGNNIKVQGLTFATLVNW
jgi:predicted porin